MKIDSGHSSTTYRTVINSLPSSSPTIFFSFLIILLSGIFLYHLDNINFSDGLLYATNLIKTTTFQTQTLEFPLTCVNTTITNQTCPRNIPRTFKPRKGQSLATTCPDYFRWIYEDLAPWNATGITAEMIQRGKENSHFRVLIVKGKLYVENFKEAYQTRDVFTIWSILQLLKLYPGEVPDLELVFSCEDRPTVEKRRYEGLNAMSPPAVFIYSGSDYGYGIVFPDWSFWGWPEVRVSPWESMLRKIKEESVKSKWKDRVPYAYWKGNPRVSWTRKDLMRCNPSDKIDWNARLYVQDWVREGRQGFKNSKLEDQCTHRYKIYIEGNGWSVSEKYILACDSTTFFVKLDFYDFFTRGLEPMKHFWPIRTRNKCRDIKFAVEWGNNHTAEAQAIGEEGTKFTEEQLAMRLVYDYMLHLLKEYAKLLKYKPKYIPNEGLMEVCIETMACERKGLEREYMEESMVTSPSDSVPCSMPPRFDPVELHDFLGKKENISRKIESWESEYWKTLNITL